MLPGLPAFKHSHPFMRLTSKPTYFTAFFTLFILALSYAWLNTDSSSSARSDMKQSLLEKLVYSNPPPIGAKVDVIYVLGGSQRSLKFKYKTAAKLFKKGISNRIWILGRPGITEYSQVLGRNFTNDEWSFLQLKKFGVPEENVEAIKIKEGLFGTFSEAKGISAILANRQYKNIALITSSEHTYRTKLSFDNFLKNQNDTIYVQSSDEKKMLRTLIVEYIKLKIYQLFLIKNTNCFTYFGINDRKIG